MLAACAPELLEFTKTLCIAEHTARAGEVRGEVGAFIVLRAGGGFAPQMFALKPALDDELLRQMRLECRDTFDQFTQKGFLLRLQIYAIVTTHGLTGRDITYRQFEFLLAGHRALLCNARTVHRLWRAALDTTCSISDPASTLSLTPIGVLRCEQVDKVDAPRQPAAATQLHGIIELLPGCNYEHALEDLAGWERIWVLFWFHHNTGWRPKVLPPRSDSGRKGVFSTRSPHRPNPIGLSALRLLKVEGLRVHVQDVDLVDGTPVLDIKPYVPYTDAFPDAQGGWLTADPVAAWDVVFSAQAEAQLQWLAERGSLPLRERALAALSLGPQPHPYRRIKRITEGALQLAIKDWRLQFCVSDRLISVQAVRSGYVAAQLARASTGSDDPRQLHRQFVAAWP